MLEFNPGGSVVVPPPLVSSARAVSWRRLSSCDAHNQFFCTESWSAGSSAFSRLFALPLWSSVE